MLSRIRIRALSSRSRLVSVFFMLIKPLMGKGLGKLPLVVRLFNFLLHLVVPERLILVESKGHKIYIDTSHQGIGHSFMSRGIYEPLVTHVLKNIVRSGMVVVDIGASVGYHTLTAARLVGEQGRVFSFEPEPYNFELLVKNIKLNGYGNITAIQEAISSKTGKNRLFIPKGQSSGSYLLGDEFTPGRYVEVDTVTLDDFFRNYTGRYAGVNLIKIDVEGAEPLVLIGMQNIIQSNEKLKIITEFHPLQIRRLGSSPEDYLNMLLAHGFLIYNLNDLTHSIELVKETGPLIEQATAHGSTNLYCVRNDD